jgi:hypothetical protein
MTDYIVLFQRWLNLPEKKVSQVAVISAIDPALIISEMQLLDSGSALILEQGSYVVYVADACQIPNTLLEIGRLREITFRDVGEGTGKSCDIEDFDLYYKQLIIWDKENQCIVGGYRIGLGDQILKKYGIAGYYISTLFKITEGFYPVLRQSMELGRSYIIGSYQKKPQPLFLLWKGIIMYMARNPHYRYLFGPVSISRNFSDVSRNVIVTYLKKYYFNKEMSKFLKPRKPYKIKSSKVDNEILVQTFGKEITNLDKFVAFTEADGSRLPVLLRQYVRQNAKFIGFNLDPKFSDCLDGFIIADIYNLPENTVRAFQLEDENLILRSGA